MTDLWLIGIGTGNPGHVTLEGQQAIRDASTVLMPRKGIGKEGLADIRHSILQEVGSKARVIPFDMPTRDDTLPYKERVNAWHDEIARRWSEALKDASDGPVALLVWGDAGLYDSTLRIAARLRPAPRVRVIPGITALQALTAAHSIPFNTVNGSVTVTTGRRLRALGWPEDAETIVVMLDGECSFQALNPNGLHIWWGAFLGMPEQILLSGPLADVSNSIVDTRINARQQHGWIMDTYLIRRCSEFRNPRVSLEES